MQLPDDPTKKITSCPFCTKVFKRVGNHLPHCKQRNGRDYSQFLTQKTLKKREPRSGKKARCPKCSKTFSRLDRDSSEDKCNMQEDRLSTPPPPPPLLTPHSAHCLFPLSTSPPSQAKGAMFFTPQNPNSPPTAPAITNSGPTHPKALPTQRPKST